MRNRLRSLAIATLVVNIGIVLTGGAVRLTNSGLGCPTWPQCTDDSWVPRGALDVHSAVEFGNRMLAFVVAATVVICWVAILRAKPRPPRALLLITIVALGVPLQAVIGGLSVWYELHPLVVGLHFMLSMAMVALSTALVFTVGRPGDGSAPAVPRLIRLLAWSTFAAGFVVLAVGTVVTGSGPHAGDDQAPRTGLDPELISHLHAESVFLLVGLTIGTLVALHAVGAPKLARTAAAALLAVELGQGAVGFTQYFTGLPELLVGLHLLGAALLATAVTAVVMAVERPVRPAPPSDPEPAGMAVDRADVTTAP